MAHEKRTVAGYECNLTLSKDRTIVRSACVLVGPADQPGWRASDGPEAKRRRREAKRAIMEALNLPAKQVRVSARYSCLVPLPGGMIGRRGPNGQITGAYDA